MKLLLPLVLFLPGAALAVCPMNNATGYGPGGSYDYQSSGPTWIQGVYGGNVSYDLVVGTFSASGGGGGGEQSGGVGLSFSDVYQIVGPASVNPIPFQVVVHLTGNLSASSYFYPYIGNVCNSVTAHLDVTSGAASASYQQGSYSQACTAVDVDHDVSLALSKLPAEPFTVQHFIQVYGSAGGGVNGTFTFVGLPPGYSVTSCQGYSSPPTPAEATSWGSLKASYR
jgi:hypothetical protein